MLALSRPAVWFFLSRFTHAGSCLWLLLHCPFALAKCPELESFYFCSVYKKQTPSCGGSWLVSHVPLLSFPEFTNGATKGQAFCSIAGHVGPAMTFYCKDHCRLVYVKKPELMGWERLRVAWSFSAGFNRCFCFQGEPGNPGPKGPNGQQGPRGEMVSVAMHSHL